MNTKLLKKHGSELALRAYQLSRSGEGPSTIAIYLNVPFRTADGLINLGRELATSFSTLDVGESVVYSHPDGGSVSARILYVKARTIVQLGYAVPYAGEKTTVVPKDQWHRLTRFGAEKFLAL